MASLVGTVARVQRETPVGNRCSKHLSTRVARHAQIWVSTPMRALGLVAHADPQAVVALPARLESVLKGLAENGSGNRHRHHELFEVLGRRSWLTEQADMGIRSPDVV